MVLQTTDASKQLRVWHIRTHLKYSSDISFPSVERADGRSGEIRLREDTSRNLRFIRNECTGLQKLQALVYGKRSKYLLTECSENTQSVRDVLVRITAGLRSIASLNTIIVMFCNGSPASWIKGCLEDLGWIVLISGI